ncbi:MAG: hypothetical protein J3Q66DRAFT_437747 [Benniella sp.]|nr:MAG: hypothetical protein J3Q66DRAFT_437747 [Benniella sp.]
MTSMVLWISCSAQAATFFFFSRETPWKPLVWRTNLPATNGAPGIIERTALGKNGEICNKLFYQGTHGVMTTVLPFKIASLSGTYNSTIYETDLEDGLFDKEFVQYTQTNG